MNTANRSATGTGPTPDADRSLSALPSVGVRIGAFAAILLSGLAGRMIGYSLVALQCDGDCGLAKGLGLLVGAVVAAGGMAIVAVLVMRAHRRVARDRGPHRRRSRAAMTSPDGTTPAELRALATDLAERAGSLALAGRRRLGAGAAASPTTRSRAPTDPVTEFDRAAEALIVDALRVRRPDDSIVGEEGAGPRRHLRARVAHRSDRRHGQLRLRPAGVVHLGRRRRRDGPLAGAVYVPVTDELYSAARGAGATRNGEPIRVLVGERISQWH